MEQKTIIEMINVLNKNLKNNDCNIIFRGTLDMILKIKNLKFFICNEWIILLSGKDVKLKIDTYWISDIIINKRNIILEMESEYTITIDC